MNDGALLDASPFDVSRLHLFGGTIFENDVSMRRGIWMGQVADGVVSVDSDELPF